MDIHHMAYSWHAHHEYFACVDHTFISLTTLAIFCQSPWWQAEHALISIERCMFPMISWWLSDIHYSGLWRSFWTLIGYSLQYFLKTDRQLLTEMMSNANNCLIYLQREISSDMCERQPVTKNVSVLNKKWGRWQNAVDVWHQQVRSYYQHGGIVLKGHHVLYSSSWLFLLKGRDD